MRSLREGVVLVTGAFDPLHEGHRSYFKQARSFGSRLVCVVALNQTIERHKKRIAWQSESVRLQLISQEPMIDEVVLGDLADPYACLDRILPEVICIGYDQAVFIDRLSIELSIRGMATRIERVASYAPERYKSSFSRVIHKIH